MGWEGWTKSRGPRNAGPSKKNNVTSGVTDGSAGGGGGRCPRTQQARGEKQPRQNVL